MLKHFQLLKKQWSIYLKTKGIIDEDGEIKSDLEFLNKDYFEKHIKNRDYVKLKDKYWAIKSGNKYIVDEFDGVDKLIEDLKQKSIKDSLTGCYNKEETEIFLETFLKNFLRYKTPFSVLMIDIDYFKKINDTYGHLAGDFILKKVAEIMKSLIRDTDICGRFGGEEFIIALPNTKIIGALRLAERIRKTIENTSFDYNGKKIKITLSIGVTSASKNDSIYSLIERADEALYEAKRKGRNRVEYR